MSEKDHHQRKSKKLFVELKRDLFYYTKKALKDLLFISNVVVLYLVYHVKNTINMKYITQTQNLS